ncbi:MAG: hypothetical protein SGPRY_014434 [Prymnesium sp.]
MNEIDASAHSKYVERYENTGTRSVIGRPIVVKGKHRDGSEISVTLSVSPMSKRGHYIAILYQRTDAVARAKAEAAVWDLRSVLDNLAEPVVTIDKHAISGVNDAALSTFGYKSADELVGQNVSVLMNEIDASAHSKYVERYEDTGTRKVIGRPIVVKGKHRDGSEISVTLSVSPMSKRGEYLAILYHRTDAEARAKAEAAEARACSERDLLALQLENIKMQLQHSVQMSPTHVYRSAKVVAAWTREWKPPSPTEYSSMATSFCIAALSSHGRTFTGRLIESGKDVGEPVSIKKGSHAFVKLVTEPFLRLTIHAKSFGECSGHTWLASEMPVLYAGEMEFDDDSQLIRWNNLSGTYQPDDAMSYQTGLPLELFWCVHKEKEPDMDPARVHVTSRDLILYRVLACSDDDFADARADWERRVKEWRAADQDAASSYQNFQMLSTERAAAVTKYGYLSSVA